MPRKKKVISEAIEETQETQETMAETPKRTQKTKEEKIKEIEEKIEKYKAKITALEAEKERVQNSQPRTRQKGMNTLIKKLKEETANGNTSVQELAEKLGIKLD